MIDMRGRLVTPAILATLMAPAVSNSHAGRIGETDLSPRPLAFLDHLPRAPRLR